MKYIVLLNDIDTNKQYRFINVFEENEAKKLFIPNNCTLIDEENSNHKEIMEIPIIHDGLCPLLFNPSEAFVEFVVDKRDGNLIIAAALIATGYCQNELKKNTKISNGKALILQERLELLNYKSIAHNLLLVQFKSIENNRENPFDFTIELQKILNKIDHSKDEIISVVNDIENIFGDGKPTILSDFKK